MNINPDSLTAAGYHSYPHHKGEGCTHFFQRTVRDKDGTKLYFIDFYLWDFSEMARMPRPKSVEVEVHLFQPGTISDPKYTDLRITIPVWNYETHIMEIEALCAELYSKLGCIPNYHNN